jgi:hypothetical protein
MEIKLTKNIVMMPLTEEVTIQINYKFMARTGHHHHLYMLGTDFFKFSVESTLTI